MQEDVIVLQGVLLQLELLHFADGVDDSRVTHIFNILRPLFPKFFGDWSMPFDRC